MGSENRDWKGCYETNYLQIGVVEDIKALHCQPSTNFDSKTALILTNSASISANGC